MEKDFLVQLANESEVVREYLGVKDWKNIVKITSNSVHRFVGIFNGKPQFQARFTSNRRDLGVSNIVMRFAQENVFKSLDKKHKYSESLMYNNVWKPQLVKYASASFNPDADPESTCVDGDVRWYSGGQTDWATIHDAAAGHTAYPSGTAISVGRIDSGSTTNQFTSIRRAFFLFDTSSLTADATVSGATFSLYGQYAADDMSISPSYNVYASTPASNTDLVADDYDQVGTTAYCDSAIAHASFSVGSYNDWVLNSTGLAAISLTGITKLGTREATYDTADSAPTWSASASSLVQTWSSDHGSVEPQLDVTYSVLSSYSGAMTLMGAG